MMSRLSLLVIVVLVLAAQACGAAAPVAKNSVGIIPPIALYVPAAGKIVTEVNMSDNDVLGVVKLLLSQMSLNAEDPGSFADAVTGVKAVRVLVIQLPKETDSAKAMGEAEAWVGKTGKFTKIVSDSGSSLGQVSAFAQANNAGYVAFVYNAEKSVMYAGRLIGSVDVPKLMGIVAGFAPVVQAVESFKEPTPVSPSNPPAPK